MQKSLYKINNVANKHLKKVAKLEFLGFIEKSKVVEECTKNRMLFVKKEPLSKSTLQIVQIVKKLTSNQTKDGEIIGNDSTISTFFKKLLRNF